MTERIIGCAIEVHRTLGPGLLDWGYRIDLLVDDSVIVELKSVDQLVPVHEAQLLTYMKLAQIRTGLLINLNQQRLIDGLRRFKL